MQSPTVQFKTELTDMRDGRATYGSAFVRDARGAWRWIGQTRSYRTYPRAVRARDAAVHICRTYARKHFPLHAFVREDA